LSDSSLPRVSPSSFVLLPLCSPSISYAGIRWHCARGHLCVWLVRPVRPIICLPWLCVCGEGGGGGGRPPSCQPIDILPALRPASPCPTLNVCVLFTQSHLFMQPAFDAIQNTAVASQPPVTPPLGPSLHPHSPLPLYPNSISHYPPYRSCDPSGKAAPSR
jgi:hypothetical protein